MTCFVIVGTLPTAFYSRTHADSTRRCRISATFDQGLPCSYCPQRGQSTLLIAEPNVIDAGVPQIAQFWEPFIAGVPFQRGAALATTGCCRSAAFVQGQQVIVPVTVGMRAHVFAVRPVHDADIGALAAG